MLTGNLGTFIRQKARNGIRPLRNLERRAKRRHVLVGYPMEPISFSKEEIDAYFSGDTIVCLLCGKKYKRLAIHLPAIHGKTENEYKGMFGLPWSRGLTSATSRQNYAASVFKQLDDGTRVLPVATNWRKGKKRASEFIKKVRLNNLSIKEYKPDVFDVFLGRVRSGRTPADVRRDKDMPHFSWFHSHYKIFPNDRIRLNDVIEGMSYPFQAKCGRLGARFIAEAQQLRSEGMEYYNIAKVLGVTAMAVHHRLNKKEAKI